jgi:hypothetical protein
LFGSDSSVEDNTLLTKAWSEGWRPSEDGYKSIEWLIKNSKYQTEKFKKEILPRFKEPDIDKEVSDILQKNIKGKTKEEMGKIEKGKEKVKNMSDEDIKNVRSKIKSMFENE